MQIYYILRVQLWDCNCRQHNHKCYKENIEANIQRIDASLHDIMTTVSKSMDGWKFLPRYEAAISTEDERKQIRCCHTPGKGTVFMDFHGDQGKDRVSLEELCKFGSLIEKEINSIIEASCGLLLIADISNNEV
jgi:hypothetical protein